MGFRAFVINLPRAGERREFMKAWLESSGIEYELVSAVDGQNIHLPHPDFDEAGYRLWHGKSPNPSEIGCYFSHLVALKAFLASSARFGLILEDDVWPQDAVKGLLEKAQTFGVPWDMIRLTGLHHGANLPVFRLDSGYSLTLSLFRQTGAGAYMVTREGARKLLEGLSPMRLPFDHAFDREWCFGAKVFHLTPFPFSQQQAFETQIRATSRYKLPAWKRYLTVLPFRMANEVSRFAHRSLRALKILATRGAAS